MRTITNPKTGQTIETSLSDNEAIKMISDLPADKFSFEASLCDQWRRRGLSEVQFFYVHVSALRELERRKPKPLFDRSSGNGNEGVELGSDVFKVLRRMFDKAAEKLQYPKIRFATGTLKIQMTVATAKAKVPGSINVVNLDDRTLWYGRIVEGDVFEKGRSCTDEVLQFVKKFAKDPIGEAVAYGKLTGVCCFCHHELTHQSSMDRGYGPICAEKWGLEHCYEDVTRPDVAVDVSK